MKSNIISSIVTTLVLTIFITIAFTFAYFVEKSSPIARIAVLETPQTVGKYIVLNPDRSFTVIDGQETLIRWSNNQSLFIIMDNATAELNFNVIPMTNLTTNFTIGGFLKLK